MLYAMIAGLSVYAPAPTVEQLPKSMPPELAIVRLEKDGSLVIHRPVAKEVTYNVTEFVAVKKPGNVIENVPVTTVRKKVMQELVPVAMRVMGLQGYDTDGKPIAGERLAELLRKDSIVLLYRDGQKPDPAYSRVVRDNTVILVLPPANAGAGDPVRHAPK